MLFKILRAVVFDYSLLNNFILSFSYFLSNSFKRLSCTSEVRHIQIFPVSRKATIE